MQFKQTNNNAGDVNNAISEKGNVVQTIGTGRTAQADHPENFWGTTVRAAFVLGSIIETKRRQIELGRETLFKRRLLEMGRGKGLSAVDVDLGLTHLLNLDLVRVEVVTPPDLGPVPPHICIVRTVEERVVPQAGLAEWLRAQSISQEADASQAARSGGEGEGTAATIRGGMRGFASDENVSERLPKTDCEADLLKPEIAGLLRRIPETWTEFDMDSLTAVQSNALFLLTAAGMVERRGRVRCEMVNHPTCTEETFEATGEGGFVEALEYSTAAMWQVWDESYREWRKKMPEGTPAFRAEAIKPQEWRLTAEGAIARGDLDGTHTDGSPGAVFDFVLKRGFYGPGHWLRIMAVPELFRKHEQEIRDRIIADQDLHTLPRPPVRGSGRLIEFRKVERPIAPQAGNLAKSGEGTDALSAVFGKMLGLMFEAMSKGQQMSPRVEPGVTRQCRILFLAANPAGTNSLALDDECREIEQKIRASDYRSALEFITKWAVRPDDLLQHLNQFKPHVVHFSGHGSRLEEIVLSDKDRQPKPVGKAALRQLFSALRDNIRLVVLNACFSHPQAKAITEVIDCAIGMRQAIGDLAAITFAASFYRALGFGRSIQEAFEQGKTALMLEGIPEQDTPELLVRSGVDPNAIVLVS
jgi:hypothetical protein